MSDDEGPMTHTGRAFLERIDRELAYVDAGRDETRALFRELRTHLCKLEGDVWAAEAGQELDGCIVGELRESALRITGGNCTFADDDLAVLAHLAQRAVDAKLTDKLSPSIRKNIARRKARPRRKQAGRKR